MVATVSVGVANLSGEVHRASLAADTDGGIALGRSRDRLGIGLSISSQPLQAPLPRGDLPHPGGDA